MLNLFENAREMEKVMKKGLLPEVGEADGRIALIDALLGKGNNGTPGGKVIHVCVSRFACGEAMDEPAIHLVGHGIMNGAERCANQFCVKVFHARAQVTSCADEVNTTVVGLRRHDIVFEQNCHAAGCAHQRCTGSP